MCARRRAPQDLRDGTVEGFVRREEAVPPDRDSAVEQVDEPLNQRVIGSGIADEDVVHRRQS